MRPAKRTVPECTARRREADLLRRHDVAIEDIQQSSEPGLRPHIAYMHDINVDRHLPLDERGMFDGE